MKTIVPVIEGHSETHSIGLLLRRVARERLLEEIAVERAIRVPRGRIVKEDEVARAIHIARRRPRGDGIVFLCDSDDDCPATLGPELSHIVRTQANPLPATFVFADREYEAWFLGAIESLRGRRGISPTAEAPIHPERIRDAKGHLSGLMSQGNYVEVDDQPALTALFSLDQCHQACRSFRKFEKECNRIISEIMIN